MDGLVKLVQRNKWIFLVSTILSLFLISLCIQASETPPTNIYAATGKNMFSPAIQGALPRVYVPNSKEGTVSVIDPATYQVIATFRTGKNPQHVVPAYDLQTLWVLNNRDNSATPIDPKTGLPGKNIAVVDPYNLYFTPDGKYAIVVCEAKKELQFLDPKTLQAQVILPIQCAGANHMEFSANGEFSIVTCEFSAQLMKVDIVNQKVIGYLSLNKPLENSVASKSNTEMHLDPAANKSDPVKLPANFTITSDEKILASNQKPIIQFITNKQALSARMSSMPQDIRSSADGKLFFVADMMQDGVVVIDPIAFKQVGFISTGIGTHAIYPSRDGTKFYVSNRGCHRFKCLPHGPGSVSVIDPIKKTVIGQWPIPNGGSPDMGNVTADGKELWLSGRYDNEVYVFDTEKGVLSHRIPVGKSPHGLTVWPQPGRFSLGHTGNMR